MQIRKLVINSLTITFIITAFSSCFLQSKSKKKHIYLEKTYKALKDSLDQAEVSILNDTIKVLFPNDLLFKVASSEVSEKSEPLVIRFANALNTYSHTSILVNGYTDNTGESQNNINLSKNRADNVKTTLVFHKVAPNRIFTWGLGDVNPIATNETETGRARNRRVEFIILYDYKGAESAKK